MPRHAPLLSLLLLSTCGPVLGADAAPMEHHDLASLWFLADHVVKAETISHQSRHEEWNTTTTYRLTHVYGGDLRAGDEVEVYDDAYRTTFQASWDLSDPEHPVERMPPRKDPEEILFLTPAPPRLIREGLMDGEGLFQKVPSGQRLLAGGRVYRFEQWSNPGAYAPVVQGPDPEDVFGLVEGWQVALTLPEFEGELEEARARAEAAEAALATEDPEERVAELLALLPPPATFPARERHPSTGFAADGLSVHLQQAIAAEGDLDAMLDAFGRDLVPSMRGYDGRAFLDPDLAAGGAALLGAAGDTGRHRHHRYAALRLLAGNRYAIRDDPDGARDRIAGLLEDPDPWIRATAVLALGRLGGDDGVRSIVVEELVSHASSERHPEVLIAAGRQLRTLDAKISRLDPLLREGRELVAAVRPGPRPCASGRELVLGHGYLIQHHDWSPAVTLIGRAVSESGGEREAESVEVLAASHGQDGGHGLARYTFDPPLEPGDWRVYVRVRVSPHEIERPVLVVSSPPIPVVVPR